MKRHSRYVDRRGYNAVLLASTAFAMIAGRYLLNDMAVKATEIISPLQDGYVLVIERDVPVVTYTIPDLVEDQIKMVFGRDAEIMIKVAKCESGLNPKARNKESTATGVFQVMASIHGVSRNRLENSIVNISVAKELFDASGTNPWNASKHCWGSK